MNPKDTKVIITDIIQRNDYVKSFRFKLPEAKYIAGQYAFVTVNANGKDVSKPLTLSSSPTERYLEFTKKISSSDFSKALNSLKTGDEIKVRLPYGNFVIKEGQKKVTFITGGIGITPVRSICKYLTDSNSKIDVKVLLSINTPADDVFKSDFDSMVECNNNLKVARTITSKNEDLDKYDQLCRFGYIDKDMIQCEVPDCSGRVFFISGPPKMVDSMKCILKEELLLLDANIIIENFVGY